MFRCSSSVPEGRCRDDSRTSLHRSNRRRIPRSSPNPRRDRRRHFHTRPAAACSLLRMRPRCRRALSRRTPRRKPRSSSRPSLDPRTCHRSLASPTGTCTSIPRKSATRRMPSCRSRSAPRPSSCRRMHARTRRDRGYIPPSSNVRDRRPRPRGRRSRTHRRNRDRSADRRSRRHSELARSVGTRRRSHRPIRRFARAVDHPERRARYCRTQRRRARRLRRRKGADDQGRSCRIASASLRAKPCGYAPRYSCAAVIARGRSIPASSFIRCADAASRSGDRG